MNYILIQAGGLEVLRKTGIGQPSAAHTLLCQCAPSGPFLWQNRGSFFGSKIILPMHQLNIIKTFKPLIYFYHCIATHSFRHYTIKKYTQYLP